MGKKAVHIKVTELMIGDEILFKGIVKEVSVTYGRVRVILENNPSNYHLSYHDLDSVTVYREVE